MSLDDDGNPGGVRRPKPPPLGDEIEQMPNPSAGSSLLPKRIDMPVKNTFIQFPALCPSPAPPRDAPHTTPATMASHIASSLRSAAYGLDFFEPIQNVHHPIQHFRNPDPRPSAQTSAGRPQIPFFFLRNKNWETIPRMSIHVGQKSAIYLQISINTIPLIHAIPVVLDRSPVGLFTRSSRTAQRHINIRMT